MSEALVATGLILLALSVFYFGFVVWCSVGWRRLSQPAARSSAMPRPGNGPTDKVRPAPFISVVIPARNERDNICRCVHSILRNDFPTDRYEIVVVDDGSTDGTLSTVEEAFPEVLSNGRLKITSSSGPSDSPFPAGKQLALDIGISQAKGEYILTTDADCTVAHDWIHAMTQAMSLGAPVVAGPVAYRDEPTSGAFAKLQALELSGLVAVGAGSIANGYPTICNSANLGYRRDVYDRWRTHPSFATGVATAGLDETIVLEAKAITGTPPVFVRDRGAIVFADPSDSLPAFLRQRVRWASMGGRYPRAGVVAISILIFAYYLLLVVSPVLGLWPQFAAAGLVKVASDAILLGGAVGFAHDRRLMRLFPIGEILHVPYILVTATVGAFSAGQWKNRRS